MLPGNFMRHFPGERTLVALIVPHAGYKYSGATAAAAYSLLQGQSFDTIIIIHAGFAMLMLCV